jgi:hypothetical protein
MNHEEILSVKADFGGVCLARANLSNANLILGNLTGADLSKADLSNANLTMAKLRWANLSEANLTDANLTGADLREADFGRADLTRANLTSANLTAANLRGANLGAAKLTCADLTGANLRKADFGGANLSKANLSDAHLAMADLIGADLSDTNLSGARGLLRSSDFMSKFNFTADGVEVYKRLGATEYSAPDHWTIKENAVLTEECNSVRTCDCGCGINFGTKEWCNSHYTSCDLWLCVIQWIDLCDVVVPYNTDGKARCSRLKLIRKL